MVQSSRSITHHYTQEHTTSILSTCLLIFHINYKAYKFKTYESQTIQIKHAFNWCLDNYKLRTLIKVMKHIHIQNKRAK